MRGYTTSSMLLARLADGEDRLAWHEFCAQYGDLIRGYAKRWGLQPADRDDVVQDVLTEVTKSIEGFEYDRERGRFRGFLKTITTRVILKRLRRREPGGGQVQGDAALGAHAAEDEIETHWDIEWRRHHMRRAMQMIESEFNEATRLAFQRYAVDGVDVDRVAAETGLSRDQVYQSKSRILRRLGELVETQVAEEG